MRNMLIELTPAKLFFIPQQLMFPFLIVKLDHF